jgi:hypothetical protein
LIFFKNNHPEIHKFFPDGPPKTLKFRVMRAFIMVDGVPHYMSHEIEDYFASGKNFEHSEGSVHQTKLEALFKVWRWWCEALNYYKQEKITVRLI